MPRTLFQHRWPKGFVCPDCGNTTGCQLARGVCQCHHQTSLTAVTIFYASHLPLTTWLQAICLLIQRNKTSLSTLQLSRELGVSYKTAWKLKRMLPMHERHQRETLIERIEIVDADLVSANGRRSAGAALSTRSRSSMQCRLMTTTILSVFSCAA